MSSRDGSRWIDHGSVAELSAQRLSRQVVEGVDVLLCWTQGQPRAYHNRCSHLDKPLDGGRLIAGQIQCPFHGACFDVHSGAALSGPVVSPLAPVPVKVAGGRVLFDVAAPLPGQPLSLGPKR